jgi:hypothetical protein
VTCTDTSCSNGGTCKIVVNRIECDCPVGFTGMLCQYQTDSLNVDGLIGKMFF